MLRGGLQGNNFGGQERAPEAIGCLFGHNKPYISPKVAKTVSSISHAL